MRVFPLFLVLMVASAAGQAQTSDDPREVGLDLFSQLTSNAPPDAIAVRLDALVKLFRFQCLRLTDYQMFGEPANIINLKVKCSGDPLYGVTVAANGYVSVYGGNGMLEPFDPRDGTIYGIRADGGVDALKGPSVGEKVKGAAPRVASNVEQLVYFGGALLLILLIFAGFLRLWLRSWRRQGKRPLIKRHDKRTAPVTSSYKDRLIDESEQIARHIYRHPQGFFIARGGRGRRRLFKSRFGAQLYTSFNIKFLEVSAKKLGLDTSLTPSS